ncbi:MAG: hypothetical protein KAT43_03840 [Nanoarchaeota archaeon]|nr:hypothetical protein [Nanoarchaeota archaeon]
MVVETLVAIAVTVIMAIILGVVFSRLFSKVTKGNRFTSILLSFIFVIIALPVSIAIGMAATIALGKVNPIFLLSCVNYTECFGEAFLSMFLMGLFGVIAYLMTIVLMFFRKIKK